MFDATGCSEGSPGADDAVLSANFTVIEGGQVVPADPLRLAMCKLWLADVCASPSGCSTGDLTTGQLPDLLCLSNVGQSAPNKLPLDQLPKSGTKGRYFGLYLVDVCEIETQLLPSAEMAGLSGRANAPRVRYFMTCSKMSGK